MALQIELTEEQDSPAATWITGGQHEYIRRVQCVLTDDGVDPVVDPLNVGPYNLLTQSTLENYGLALGKPWELRRGGSAVDGDPFAICRSITPERDPGARNKWTITAVYNTLAESDNTYNEAGNEDFGDWLEERPLVRWQNIMFTEHARDGYQYSKGARTTGAEPGHFTCPPQRDTPGNWVEMNGGLKGGLTNSAGGWLGDPPPERDMQRTGWVIERNLNTFDQTQIDRLTNSVNTVSDFSFQWQGQTFTIPRYFGKIKQIMPREHFRGGTWVWRVRYEIDVNPRSWVEDFLDEGFQVIKLSSLPAAVFGAMQQQNITDINGLQTAIPALLDGKGEILPIGKEGSFDNIDLSQVCYASYLLYEKQDWNSAENWMMSANFPNNHNQST